MNLDEQSVVAKIERLTLRELRVWIREGWVRPAQGETGPVFDDLDVARIRLLCDLRKDMALPSDALPPVLALIDQLHRVRRELRWLSDAIDEQSDDVRTSIAASVSRRIKQRE